MNAFMSALRDRVAAAAAEIPHPPGGAAPLRAVGLTKHYRGKVALEHVDLELGAGESLLLLGPNGAGKTTLLHLCAGLLVPDAGEVYLGGTPARLERARAAIGLVPQALAVYPRLTVRENLAFFARVLGVRRAELRERVDHGLWLCDLAARADDLAGKLSTGMQRRLNFACAVLHRPRVLLLDEPTVGVDARSREHLYAAIEAERRAGVTLVCSTHSLDEAERLADRVLVLHHGRVCADGSPAALFAAHGSCDLHDLLLRLTSAEDAP